MSHRIYLYPLWLRLWHWLNALMFLILILTGISMHYANLESPFISFDTSRVMHNTAGIILSILYIGFIIGNLISGNWRHYLPAIKGIFSRLFTQAKYYLFGIFAGKPHPYHPTEKDKFNPLQQLTYLNIMYVLMPILIVTGLFLLFPETAPEQVMGAGGIWPMAIAHSVAGFLATVFMVGHIYLATTGAKVFTDFKEMITGWHESETSGKTKANKSDNN